MRAKGSQQRTNVPTMTAIIRVILYTYREIRIMEGHFFNNQLLSNTHKEGWNWEFAHPFSERIARFLRKNEQMSDSLKKRAIRSFTRFCERPEGFAHGRSFFKIKKPI